VIEISTAVQATDRLQGGLFKRDHFTYGVVVACIPCTIHNKIRWNSGRPGARKTKNLGHFAPNVALTIPGL
jgi:hypothetical protein